MKLTRKDIIKLLISLALTAWVVYYVSKEIDWNELVTNLQKVNYSWVALSVFLSILSHVLRAYRWKLLLETGNYKTKVSTTYFALMTGYLANMAIPRLGEVVRCTALSDQDDIPVSFSLGTVVTDRLLDLFMLGIATLILLLTDFALLGGFFVNFVDSKLPWLAEYWPYLLLAGLGGLVFLFWLFKESQKKGREDSILLKLVRFIKETFQGVWSVTRVKHQAYFWLSTLGIWVLYFLMLYVISFGYGPTADLSLTAGLAVLVMGSLGMATPVQNGIGAYQKFVAEMLVLYGITYTDGFTFAVVSHGSQVIAVIVIGFISLMILNFRKRKKQLAGQQSENSKPGAAQSAH